MKQLKPDPWQDLPAHYPVGARVRGKVVSLTDYGAFVELEEGVEGLIHVSEMSWTKKVKNPSKLLSVGDIVEAVIADVNPETRRLSLSLRATEPNPWEMLAEKYRIGDRIQGIVRNLTDFGAFVEIEDGIDGLVHISDMSWGRRVKHPSEVLKKGDQIQAVLTAIDVENRRISLSIKEFRPNEWEEFAREHKPGDIVDGQVAKVADFGVFVRLPLGLEGLMHVSETDVLRGQKLSDEFREGDPIRVRILRIEVEEQRIGLSMRDVPQPEPVEVEAEHACRGGSCERGGGRRPEPEGAGRGGDRGAEPEAETPAEPAEEAPVEGSRRRATDVRGACEEASRGAPIWRRSPGGRRWNAMTQGVSRAEETTTKADLVEEVARAAELTKKQAEAVVESVFQGIIASLRAGQKIELRGFGSFKLRQRGARVARNPKKSGVKVHVPPEAGPLLQAGQEAEGADQRGGAGARRPRRRPRRSRRDERRPLHALADDLPDGPRGLRAVRLPLLRPPGPRRRRGPDRREGNARLRRPEPLPVLERPRHGRPLRAPGDARRSSPGTSAAS